MRLRAKKSFTELCCVPVSAQEATIDEASPTGASDVFGELNEGRYTLGSGTCQLEEDVVTEGYLYVPSGVEAIIDLNGHTIDRGLTAASATGFVIKNEGKRRNKSPGCGCASLQPGGSSVFRLIRQKST